MVQTPLSLPSFKKGDLILQENPFAYILSSKLLAERCDFCLKRAELLKCTGCRIIHYCDRSCQKGAWLIHKKECQNLKRIYPKVVPDSARLMARIIFKLESGGAREQGFYTPRNFRVFMDLMSHYKDIRKDQLRMEHLESLTAVLSEYLGGTTLPNNVELLRIYGKMAVNTFSILDDEMRSIGTGMYIGASIVDHSCSPNAVVVFDGKTLNMRTLVDLPSLDFSKIFISYIDVMRTVTERQKELEETYYFHCQCSRCLDVEELNLMTSSICQNRSCNEQIPGGTKGAGAQCQHCGEYVSNETWEEISEISDFTHQQLLSMKDLGFEQLFCLKIKKTPKEVGDDVISKESLGNGSYIDWLYSMELCLQKQDRIFNPTNILRVRILDMAMESSIELGKWIEALEFGTQLIDPFRRYYGEFHPLRGIFLMKIGKMALLLNRIDDARRWLKEAVMILRITHGANHALLRGELNDLLRQCCH